MKNIILKIIYKLLAYYARKVLKKHNPFVVAITGSVGKTSTKEAIYQVLKDEFGSKNVRKTAGNLNAEIGVPLTILGYEKLPNKFLWPIFLIGAIRKLFVTNYPKYLILEMGVEHPGDIGYFCSIVKPDIAIVTSTTPAHFSNFKNLNEYQQEKISLIYNLKSDGMAVVNGDDPVLKNLKSERIHTVSISDKLADFHAEHYEVGLSGTYFRISTLGHKISVKSALLGQQLIYASLFAFAISKILDLSLVKVGKSLESLKPVKGRMNLIKGKNGSVIIDDTYNANPTSVRAALEALSYIRHQGRKLAIIGNMNELGQIEKKAHTEVAQFARGKCDYAIFAGPNAKCMAENFDEKNSAAFTGRKELLVHLDSLIKPNDLILVKASQNKNFFEEVVKRLMAEPEKSNITLVRQNKFWSKKKNSY